MATNMVGQIIERRRKEMDLTLARLSMVMGGSPGESFLSKVEAGKFVPTPALCVKYADALLLPADTLLNAAGHATEAQQKAAEEELRAQLFVTPPTSMLLPVMLPDDPDRIHAGRRAVLLKKKEDAFVIEFSDPANDPYVGECIVSREREPQEGHGVVVRIEDRLSAWTWHPLPRNASFIENGRGAKLTKGYVTLGVIVRVTTSRDIDA